MAYAAVNSLLQTLDKTPQPAEGIIAQFKEKVASLFRILEDSSTRNSSILNNLEAQIIDASYYAEDIIESHMHQVLSKSVTRGVGIWLQKLISAENCRPQTTDLGLQGLEKMMDEFDSILEALSKINDAKVEDDMQPGNSSSSASLSRSVGASNKNRTNPVGIDEDLLQIKDWLTGYPSKLDIISIVGMPGIGKTTLVRNLYDDLLIQQRFDTRAWAFASQDYNTQEMLRSLLDTARRDSVDDLHQDSVEQLAERLYKSLKGRRYLIVIDDVWDTEVSDRVMRYFPDDNNGSRIVLTTRLSEIATYVNSSSSVHHLKPLSPQASWSLLCKNVFGEESCPDSLEEIGKRIANSCKGLPLAIVVIGGLLSKGSRTPGDWEHIARNVKSAITENDDRFMDILSFSYNYLPRHLKPCFLYMGVFPEDHVIVVTRLIKLWVAEGFIAPQTSKSMEELAEDYLNDLVERSLIMVHKRKVGGGFKTCMIHDMLRALCMKKAHDEKFLHIMNSDVQSFRKGENSQLRVSVHSEISYQSTKVRDSYVHSFLFFPHSDAKGKSLSFTVSPRMLGVLDTLGICFAKFPREILLLVHLRYLAFVVSKCKFPTTIIRLRHLQTLIVYGMSALYLPLNFWKMTQIRHIAFNWCILPYPFDQKSIRNSIVLENLQTLTGVKNFRCTRKVFEIMPNLKKLGLSYFKYGKDWCSLEFNSFMYLHKLEKLKCCFYDSALTSLIDFAFPPTLKKLTLYGCRLPWEKMTIIGSLPNLEVLKLECHAFEGPVWEPNEAEFSKLKFLLIESFTLKHWRVNDTHFPRLQHLRLSFCINLEEIPSEIGEIATLEMIEMYLCRPSAVASARLIEEEQQSLGNDILNVFTDYPLRKFSPRELYRQFCYLDRQNCASARLIEEEQQSLGNNIPNVFTSDYPLRKFSRRWDRDYPLRKFSRRWACYHARQNCA